MSFSVTFRQRRAPWTRHVLGVFVVVWLNVVLQPCAMAMGGGDDHDCPRCPPSHARQHDVNDAATGVGMSDDVPCATGAADCNGLDELNYDGRSAQLKLKDAPHDAPVTVDARGNLLPAVQSIDLAGVCPTRSPPLGVSSPLNVLYCVYLD